MKKLVITVIVAAASVMAQTQTRSWVSNAGSDANSCTTMRPCATFAGALAKTAAGGEIDVLNSGDYGTVTIDRSITIDGKGAQAVITVPNNGTGIFVDANVTAVLRNLSITGPIAPVPKGISWTGGQLSVYNVIVTDVAYGIYSYAPANGAVLLEHVQLIDVAMGLSLQNNSGSIVSATLKDVTVLNNSNSGQGVGAASYGSGPITVDAYDLHVAGAVAGNCNAGLEVVAATVNLTRSSVENCGIGIVTIYGGQVSLNQTTVTGNITGLQGSGFYSAGNNLIAGNTQDLQAPLTFPLTALTLH